MRDCLRTLLILCAFRVLFLCGALIVFPKPSHCQSANEPELRGIPLAWVESEELWFFSGGKIFSYRIGATESKLVAEMGISKFGLYLCSNQHAFLNATVDSKSDSYRVSWERPLKTAVVRKLFSGTVDELNCSLDRSLSNKISRVAEERGVGGRYPRDPRGSRNWGGEGYFWSEVTNDFDKNSGDWPLKALWFDGNGDVLGSLSIPQGPWNWRQTFVDSIRNFSCGISCYTDFSPFVVRGSVYAWVSGKAVPDKGRGIFRLRDQEWQRIYSGNVGRMPLVSDDGLRMALVDGVAGERIRIIQLD